MACAQLELFDASEEAACYHSIERQGYFSLLVANGATSRKKQESYRLGLMPQVLSRLDRTHDTWLSQAEFFLPNRRIVNLSRIGLLFADLDTYRTPLKGLSPERQADALQLCCNDEGIPPPSLIVFSGRGLQAKWLLERAIPRHALPRWDACQRSLVDHLGSLGSDIAAKDASRVLRLVETVNSKSGEICRVIHVNSGTDGEPVRYSFEYLAECLLPLSRWDIEHQKKARKTRQARRSQPQLVLVPGSWTGGLRALNTRRLAWDRLEDLRALRRVRGGAHEGERMKFLLWELNFLMLSGAVHSTRMYPEAAALAKEIDPAWGYHSAELMTLYAKAKAWNAGETVEFNGKRYPALYTPRNDTLISMFRITDDEQRQLRTIISRSMAAERHKTRQEARRRAAGAVERSEYLDAAQERRQRALELRKQGLSVRAIAKEMGIPASSVQGYIKQNQVLHHGEILPCTKSVRITNGVACARSA